MTNTEYKNEEKFKYTIDPDNLPSKFTTPVIGSLNSRKLASKFPIINVLNEESRNELISWLHGNNFFNTLKKTFFLTSTQGGAYWITTLINGEWKLLIARRVVKVQRDIVDNLSMLISYTKVVKGNQFNYWIYEKYVKGFIYREIVTTEAQYAFDYKKAYKEGVKSSVQEMYKETGVFINPEVDTKGQMCAFYIANQFNSYDDGTEIYGKPDTAYAKPELDLLDDAWVAVKRALRVINPRLVLIKDEGSEVTYDTDMSGEEIDSTAAEETKLLDSNIITITNSMELDGNAGNFNAFIPNPQVVEYAQKQFEKSYSAVLQRAGFAGADDADSAQKSILEVSQIRDSEFAAMEDKISIFQTAAQKMVKTMGVLLNLEIGEHDGIEIQKLDVRTEVEMIDNLIKAVDAGMEEKTVAIARYKGISQTEAKTVLKNIEKEQKKKAKQAEKAKATAVKLEDYEKPQEVENEEDN